MTTTEVPLPLAAQATNATGPCSAGLRRTLPAVLRSERIKATTVRANKVLATSAIIGLLTSWATATFATDEVHRHGRLRLPDAADRRAPAIAGILLFTSEVGTRRHPHRPPVAVARRCRQGPWSLPASACPGCGRHGDRLRGQAGRRHRGRQHLGVMTTVLWGCSTPSARRCSVSASGWWSATARVPSPACSSGGWSSRPSSSNSPRPHRSVRPLRHRVPHAGHRVGVRRTRGRRCGAVEPAPRLDLLGLRHRRPIDRGGAAGETRRRLRPRNLRPDATPGARSKGAGSVSPLWVIRPEHPPELDGCPQGAGRDAATPRMREA